MKMLTLLVLLWRFICTGSVCSSAALCISNSNLNTECQDSAVISKLSSIPEYAKSCKSLDMQITSGNHILETTLNFSSAVQTIRIHGSHRGNRSTIFCQNQAGIHFSEKKYNKVIYISYLNLNNCSGGNKAALHFVYVTNYSLESVQVEDSEDLSIYAYQCSSHVISNCTFRNSRRGHIQIRFHKVCKKQKSIIWIKIKSTQFYGGNYGIEARQKHECHFGLSIANSSFSEPSQSHIVIEPKNSLKYPVLVNIVNSRFSLSSEVGISLNSLNSNGNNMSLEIFNSNFTGNNNGALRITQATKIVIKDSEFISNKGTAVSTESQYIRAMLRGNNFINNTNGAVLSKLKHGCLVINDSNFVYNEDIAIFITHQQGASANTSIFNTTFTNNSKALHIRLHGNAKQDSFTDISNCMFQKNNLSKSPASTTSVVMVENGQKTNHVYISYSVFEKNYGTDRNCSCFNIANSDSVILENVNFSENICSGMTIQSSKISILNWVNVTKSFGQLGGAIQMLSWTGKLKKFSSITLKKNALLILTENSAKLYGGGIYTDESCDSQKESRHCFLQTNTNDTAISLAGNRAGLGGDAIFGGCLTECYINSELINVTDPDNIIYTIISLQEKSSLTAFGETPYQVAFCSNSSFGLTCAATHRLNAYRGETFYTSLIIAGSSSCFPTVGFMQARPAVPKRAQLDDLDGQESYKKSTKFCDQYKYSINADLNYSSVTMELQIHRDLPSNYAPALLTIVLDDCPAGYEFNKTERRCTCSGFLKSQKIKCVAGTRSLEVPPLTWIGEIRERPAVNKHCSYCHTERNTILESLKNKTQLCNSNREGILCGQCSGNYSLLLGGHQCGNCYKSFYKGFLLVLGFAVIGVSMVLLLLRLNITVSTGLVNGLIFYANIVYASNDKFLPTSQDSESKSSINTMVSVFSTFLAWINLDFGIVTCFFDGYDTYVSTWMQFIFPLYVWLIIVTIMLASRYSGRISKFATSNTMSVLATLLVVSYSKLFKTSIEAVSFTNVIFLNDSTDHRVWVLDGSISYLHGKHIPLFIISLLTILLYILPFTLLIIFGPLLLYKSCLRRTKIVSALIPFIRPFLKAFYRPYREAHEFWTGILLLARLITLLIFIYCQFDARPIKLVTVSSIVVVLLIVWISLSKGDTKSKLASAKYLDLLILVNLGIFAVCSVYITTYAEKRLRSQQALAVVMVGSVFGVFCCISIYKLFYRIAFVRKFCRKLVRCIPNNGLQQHTNGDNSDIQTSSPTSSNKNSHTATITHTSIVLSEIPKELGKT